VCNLGEHLQYFELEKSVSRLLFIHYLCFLDDFEGEKSLFIFVSHKKYGAELSFRNLFNKFKMVQTGITTDVTCFFSARAELEGTWAIELLLARKPFSLHGCRRR